MAQFLTRKDLSRILELSVASVRHNEQRWNIGQYRCDVNSRVVRFAALPTLKALERAGVLYSGKVSQLDITSDGKATQPPR